MEMENANIVNCRCRCRYKSCHMKKTKDPKLTAWSFCLLSATMLPGHEVKICHTGSGLHCRQARVQGGPRPRGQQGSLTIIPGAHCGVMFVVSRHNSFPFPAALTRPGFMQGDHSARRRASCQLEPTLANMAFLAFGIEEVVRCVYCKAFGLVRGLFVQASAVPLLPRYNSSDLLPMCFGLP